MKNLKNETKEQLIKEIKNLRTEISEKTTESEERFRMLFERSPDAIFVEDTDGTILDVNPAACYLHGMERDKLVGSNIIDLIPPDQQETVVRDYPKWQMGELSLYEGYSYTSDGRSIPVEIHANRIEYSGRPAMLFHVRDITDRKMAEEAIKQSEEKYRTLTENLNVGVFRNIPGGNGKFIEANPAFLKIFGYENKNEILQLNVSDLYINTDDRKNYHTDLLNLGVVKDKELLLKQKDGTPIYCSISAVSVKENNKIKYIDGIIEDITERKKAKESLRESENNLRTLFNAMTDIVFEIDYDGRYINIAPTSPELMFKPTEDTIGKTLHEIFPKPEADKFLEFIRKCLNENKTLTIEYPLIINEKTIWFEGRATPKTKNTVLYIARDITERKKAEEEIQKLSQIIETTSQCVVLSNIEGSVVYVNNAYLKISDFTEKEIIGMPMFKFSDEKGTKILKEKTIPALLTIGHWQGEMTVKRKDNSLFPADLICSLLKNKNEEPEYFVAVFSDISKRKQMAETLAEKTIMLDNILKSAVNMAIATTDLDFRITYFNPIAEKFFGHSAKEVIGKTIQEIHTMENVKSERFEMAIDTVKQKGEYNYFVEQKTPDGIRYLESRVSGILDSEGKMVGYALFSSDITGRKKAEEELQNLNKELAAQNEEYQVLNEELKENMERIQIINVELGKAKERAEESDRLKTAFLHNISHEIRTPMNGILGFTNLLLDPELTGEEQHEYIDVIKNSSDRMLNTINDLMDISMIESSQMKITVSEVNINDQITDLFTFFKSEAEKKGLQLFFKNTLPDQEAIIKTDCVKFYAILTNLIRNAIKYSDEGTIEFGYEKKGKYLEFFVKDTGIGIPKERLQAIFDRFVQADIEDIRALEGSGLGLSISKAYVEMIGGRIWVESQEGKGSEFYFTIPYNPNPEEKTTVLGETLKKKNKNQISELKVLIAEDVVAADMYLTIIVKKFSNEILHVKTGTKAVELCRKNPDIDLVLMDIRMPEMNGYDATRKIREFNKDVIIIAQTAYALYGDREKALEAGCDDYISKPINKEELMEMINKYLGNR